jgi:hypothetical protein
MAISLLEYGANTQQQAIKPVVEIFTAASVFLRRLRYIQVQDFSYAYDLQQTLGTVGFRALNNSYTSDEGFVIPKVETLRIMGGTIKTDRQLAIGERGRTRRAGNIKQKVTKAGQFFDKMVIEGDSGVDPKQFDGLRVRCQGNQNIAMGGTLTLAKLDEAIDQTAGNTKIIVCNKFIRRKISALVKLAGGTTMTEIQQQVMRYNNYDIEALDEDNYESPTLTFTEASTTTSLYVIGLGSDADEEFTQGLVRQPDGAEPITVRDDGERDGNVYDLIEGVFGLGTFHPRSVTRLSGITKT